LSRARPYGIVDLAYRPLDPVTASRRARDDGFAFVDTRIEQDPAELALPVGCPIAYPKPVPGWCMAPAPYDGAGAWEQTVRWFRAAPGALLEPWTGSSVQSDDACRAVVQEVPGLRLLLDTGHVAAWGGDPIALLEHAGHVQLRQGAPGAAQLHVDDSLGRVDFSAVPHRLDELHYRGKISIEYFDLPALGWGLEDPRAWALDLAAHLRGLE
jgi:sugar phosphate isomerase/epimerase